MFEYATDLFDAPPSRGWPRHLARLLDRDRRRIRRSASRDLPLLGDEERHGCVVEWNDTAAELPARRVHPRALRGAGAEDARCRRGRIRGRRAHLSRARRARNQLAHHLQSRGVGPDVLVGHLPRALARAGRRSARHPQGGRRLRAARPRAIRGAAGVHDRGCAALGAARHRSSSRRASARAVLSTTAPADQAMTPAATWPT